jgi:hypothetical protein
MIVFESERDQPAHYAWMFSQDVTLGLMPHRFGEDNRFGATLEGDDNAAEAARKMLQSIGRGSVYRDSLAEEVESAIEDVAGHISMQGRAIFEIVVNPDDQQYALVDVPALGLFRAPFFWVQVVKVRTPSQPPHWSKKAVRRSSVWDVAVPKALGGPVRYRRTLKLLGRPQALVPSFFNDDPGAAANSSGFDFTAYRRNTEILHAKVTRLWGWNRRDATTNYTTDYYWIYKMLTMCWAQGVLREHIVESFNELFRRLSINATLKLSGIPAAETFLTARERLGRSEITTKEASEITQVFL